MVSTDEGLKDGQILYVLFSEKANKLPAQNLYKKKKKPFKATAKHAHTVLWGTDEIPSFYQKQKFIPIRVEVTQIHTYGKDAS